MTLYEISEEYRAWMARLEENDGELTDELKEEFSAIAGSLADKADVYAKIIKEKVMFGAELKKERDRLKTPSEKNDKVIDRLLNMMAEAMGLLGRDKIETPSYTAKFVKSSGVIVTDQDKLPKEFLKETVEVKPMLSEIGKAIKRGEPIEGAYIEERRTLKVL